MAAEREREREREREGGREGEEADNKGRTIKALCTCFINGLCIHILDSWFTHGFDRMQEGG